MHAILLQSARIALALLVLYAILIALALGIYPLPSTSGAIDTSAAGGTVFETQAKYLFLNRRPLEVPGTRVVFIGASNTAEGFPASLVQPHIGGALVNNVALDGSNLTQIRQVFDLTRMAIAPADRRRTVYVLGLWYGLFVDDAVRWTSVGGRIAETAIDAERYRYGFDRRTPAGPVVVVPDDRINIARIAIYPLVALEKIIRVVTQPIRERFLGAQMARTDAERNAYLPTQKDEQKETDFWIQSFAGTHVSPKQFAALNTIFEQARADHSALVILDLPIPAWHSAALPYDAEYARAMSAFLAHHHSDPLLSYVDMRNMNNNDWFSDEVHPKPQITPLWIHRVAEPINAAVLRLTKGNSPS